MSSLGRTMITTNPVTDKLRNGQPAVGTWLTLCSPVAAEAMAHVGWDWLVVDAEHSPVGFETMVNCFRAAQLGGAIPMARVPWNDTVWIQRTLDAGALGLVVPMVNSAEDAKAVVSNMKYATRGQRSFGGSRVAPYIEGEYRTWADENLAVIVMIETISSCRKPRTKPGMRSPTRTPPTAGYRPNCCRWPTSCAGCKARMLRRRRATTTRR